MRKTLKASVCITGGVFGLAVALYLFAIAINWRDRDPSPAARRLVDLYRNRPPVADEDNAFVYLMGIYAPLTDDPREIGAKRVAWLRELNKSRGPRKPNDPLPNEINFREKRSPGLRAFQEACRQNTIECKVYFDAASELAAWSSASESWLPDRYAALIAHSGWREVVPTELSTPLPSYALAMDGQRLLLLRARTLAEQGDDAGVKALLARDIRFWGMVLESSDILISKMIATAALNRHFHLGQRVLWQLDQNDMAKAVPDEWSIPISDAQRSMLRTMAGELEFTSGMVRDMVDFDVNGDDFTEGEKSTVEKVSLALTRPLYKPQDLINRFADYYSQIAAAMDVPLERYEAAGSEVAALSHQSLFKPLPNRGFYNIGGAWLAGSDASDFSSYAERVGDIEGVRRVVLAAISLRQANVMPREVAAALATSGFTNPYSGEPFRWDEETQSLVFRGLERAERGEHRIPYQ